MLVGISTAIDFCRRITVFTEPLTLDPRSKPKIAEYIDSALGKSDEGNNTKKEDNYKIAI